MVLPYRFELVREPGRVNPISLIRGIFQSDLKSLRKQPHGDSVVVAGTYLPLFVKLKIEGIFERGAQLACPRQLQIVTSMSRNSFHKQAATRKKCGSKARKQCCQSEMNIDDPADGLRFKRPPIAHKV